MNLLTASDLAQRLSVSKSYVLKNYPALPHIILGKRRQVRFIWQDVLSTLSPESNTSGIWIDSKTLAQMLKVSKSYIVKNYRNLPYIRLPNTDRGQRHLIRFNYAQVLEFLKGGDHEE